VSGTAEVGGGSRKNPRAVVGPDPILVDSPDDPHIRLIKVTPHTVEYWDAPGNFVSSLKVVFGLLTRTHPSSGERKKVAM
jgi:Pyridoxamine 5'-phosphate oxidase like